ncbi:hypothetical protein ACIQTT_07250 [Microbacterium sp. NPDC090225]|uniref:hypothetical protein n=1 Tax=Microbacterium sp. NPDC090225 TaxID=3364207 RepID=UPI00382794CA
MNVQLKIAGQSPELLGLGSVLVGSLPAAPMTTDAPDHYAVAAVSTRKADRDAVVFTPPSTSDRSSDDDDSRIEDWVEEGGAVRS